MVIAVEAEAEPVIDVTAVALPLLPPWLNTTGVGSQSTARALVNTTSLTSLGSSIFIGHKCCFERDRVIKEGEE